MVVMWSTPWTPTFVQLWVIALVVYLAPETLAQVASTSREAMYSGKEIDQGDVDYIRGVVHGTELETIAVVADILDCAVKDDVDYVVPVALRQVHKLIVDRVAVTTKRYFSEVEKLSDVNASQNSGNNLYLWLTHLQKEEKRLTNKSASTKPFKTPQEKVTQGLATDN